MDHKRHQMAKLLFMIVLTFFFFITELIYGHLTGSLALIGDSYHMISDVVALIIGLASVSISSRSSTQNTFGWARAEILGALVNSVFLAALCFTIFVEAIERMVHPSMIEDPQSLLIVGCIGLAVNLIGLFIFCNETHAHGHSHAERSPAIVHSSTETLPRKAFSATIKSKVLRKLSFSKKKGEMSNLSPPEVNVYDHASMDTFSEDSTERGKRPNEHKNKQSDNNHSNKNYNNMALGRSHVTRNIRIFENSRSFERVTIVQEDGGREDGNHFQIYPNDLKLSSSKFFNRLSIAFSPEDARNMNFNHGDGDMNIRGVLLHMMGDALGSVVVIATAIVTISGGKKNWVPYMDPVLSMVMVLIIMWTTFPLFRQSSLILLQHVPGHIHIENLQDRLSEIEDVKGIHSLHIWQLVGNKLIASVHVKCEGPNQYIKVARHIQDILNEEGICSITIQPEFVTHDDDVTKCSMLSACDSENICPTTFTAGKNKVSAHSSQSHNTLTTARSHDTTYSTRKNLE